MTKEQPKLALLVLTAASVLRLPAAVPADWEVDLAAQPPKVYTLQRPRGETYELKAVLKRHGKPFEPAITNACIYWQTNGMENLYWSAPASISNNVLRATWLPSMDPGATTVRGYIGDPGHIYAAAFQFRFIASPGAHPNDLPLPTPVIDFARVRVLNPPWSGGGGGGVDTNAVRDIANATIATNDLVVATTNRVAALETETNNLTSSVSTLSSSVSSLQSSKIDKVKNPAPVADNFAAMTADGGIKDSGKKASDFLPAEDFDGNGVVWFVKPPKAIELHIESPLYIGTSYSFIFDDMKGIIGSDGIPWYYGSEDPSNEFAVKGDIPVISATDETFSNEVATVARTVTPPPSPTLRLYDEVRQCYWLGKMVNGVMQWEVE